MTGIASGMRGCAAAVDGLWYRVTLATWKDSENFDRVGYSEVNLGFPLGGEAGAIALDTMRALHIQEMSMLLFGTSGFPELRISTHVTQNFFRRLEFVSTGGVIFGVDTSEATFILGFAGAGSTIPYSRWQFPSDIVERWETAHVGQVRTVRFL